MIGRAAPQPLRDSLKSARIFLAFGLVLFGLLSGIATAVKLASPGTQVWGAEPALAADAKESFETKTLVEWPATKTTRTIGDGLRTQSLGALNFEHVLRYVDGIDKLTFVRIASFWAI